MDFKHRVVVAALSLSAFGFAGLVMEENYTGNAVIPTKGDRPTVGFGSTFRDDGSPVQMGDTITPPQAIVRSLKHIAKDEVALKRCVTGAMHQVEYDILLKFSYQYGAGATCSSSMVRHINAGRYAQACESYTAYRLVRAEPGEKAGVGFVRGMDGVLRFDCSTPGNKRCLGVWTRNLERRDQCRAAQ